MKALIVAVLVVIAGLVVGCSNTDTPAGPAVPKSDAAEAPADIEEYQARADEIIMVDLPTLADMTEKLIQADPDISESELRAQLFADLKALKAEVDAGRIPHAKIAQYPTCSQEWWLLYWNSSYIIPTKRASDNALAEARRQWPGDQEDTKADAFRHSYWNILLAKRINLGWASAFTTAHESCRPDDLPKFMDLHNNDIGRRIYSSQKSQSESQFSDIVKRYSYLLVTSVKQMSTSALVYRK